MLKKQITNSLNIRVFIYTLLFSTFFTILVAGFQIFFSYKNDVKLIDSKFKRVEKDYLASLSRSVWELNQHLVKIQLKDMLAIKDISYVELKENTNELSLKLGKIESKNSITKKFKLFHVVERKKVNLGTLTVQITLKNIHEKMFHNASQILISEVIKTFCVSFFILFIIYKMIIQHLIEISDYSRKLKLSNLDKELVLSRKKHKSSNFDELDEMISAINDMNYRLKKQITEEEIIKEKMLHSQKMEALGTLAGGIAHDFNNILAAILGFSDLLTQNPKMGKKELTYLSNIKESVLRAKNLVQKILTVNRPPNVVNFKFLKLETLVEEVITIIKASISPNINIIYDLKKDLPAIKVDPDSFYQMLLNLLTNSIQAMPEGGKLTIKLNQEQYTFYDNDNNSITDAFMCLSIKDTGCGMNQQTISRMYDPFFTTKELGSEKGTGLGLSIVLNVVKHHNAHIEVESSLGKGTVFKIYFPINEIDEQKTKAPSLPANKDLITGDKNILLIDDEKMILNVGSKMLKKLGYNVKVCTDSQKALALFKENPKSFDLILTDYSMPGFSGCQVIEKIREIRKDIPVILLTGYSNLKSTDIMEKWDFAAIILKPFTLETLSKTVSDLFR